MIVIIVFVGTAEINNNSVQHFVKHIVCITETEIEQHQIQKNGLSEVISLETTMIVFAF
jgi:hypothetical protein